MKLIITIVKAAVIITGVGALYAGLFHDIQVSTTYVGIWMILWGIEYNLNK